MQFPETFDLEEIGLVLSRVVRWGGQGNSVCTVAEHLVRVSYSYGFPGLMHDAHEYILGDMITPIKKMLPDYKLLCKILQKKIERYFNIPDCKINETGVAEWEWRNYFVGEKKPWSQAKSFKIFMKTALP